ncbi:hypothetical protein CSHISOI_03533 [Colletotrichum shisoi]|uniref:Uncharacterized protein n=1 Tax=Colletotrichum shisoi TaxID=2078593 RepID=A0A5Q4BZN4_9PEZI|nr:hypothetical protein CSHISOI_03533 [Colletotrichum shisoi]
MLHWLKKNVFSSLACPSPRGTGTDEARCSDPSSLPRWESLKVLGISPTPQSSRVRRAIRATEEGGPCYDRCR